MVSVSLERGELVVLLIVCSLNVVMEVTEGSTGMGEVEVVMTVLTKQMTQMLI